MVRTRLKVTEIAARAHYEHEPELNMGEPIPWRSLNEHVRDHHRDKVRAVLTALQNAMLERWGKYLDYLETQQDLELLRTSYTRGPGIEHAERRQFQKYEETHS